MNLFDSEQKQKMQKGNSQNTTENLQNSEQKLPMKVQYLTQELEHLRDYGRQQDRDLIEKAMERIRGLRQALRIEVYQKQMTQEENQRLERKIADIQAQNSNLEKQITRLTKAVEKAVLERNTAQKQVIDEKNKSSILKKNAKEDIHRIRKYADNQIVKVQQQLRFWQVMAVIVVIMELGSQVSKFIH